MAPTQTELVARCCLFGASFPILLVDFAGEDFEEACRERVELSFRMVERHVAHKGECLQPSAARGARRL